MEEVPPTILEEEWRFFEEEEEDHERGEAERDDAEDGYEVAREGVLVIEEESRLVKPGVVQLRVYDLSFLVGNEFRLGPFDVVFVGVGASVEDVDVGLRVWRQRRHVYFF
jgi:hypothetical protein